jgi:hypothetical protein
MTSIKIFKLSNTNSDKYYIGVSALDGSILKIYTDPDYRFGMGVELKIGIKFFEFLHSQDLIGSFYVTILKELELQDTDSIEDFVNDEIEVQQYLDEEAEIEHGILNDKLDNSDRYEFQFLS